MREAAPDPGERVEVARPLPPGDGPVGGLEQVDELVGERRVQREGGAGVRPDGHPGRPLHREGEPPVARGAGEQVQPDLPSRELGEGLSDATGGGQEPVQVG